MLVAPRDTGDILLVGVFCRQHVPTNEMSWEKHGERVAKAPLNSGDAPPTKMRRLRFSFTANFTTNIAFAENRCHIHRKRCGYYALYSRET